MNIDKYIYEYRQEYRQVYLYMNIDISINEGMYDWQRIKSEIYIDLRTQFSEMGGLNVLQKINFSLFSFEYPTVVIYVNILIFTIFLLWTFGSGNFCDKCSVTLYIGYLQDNHQVQWFALKTHRIQECSTHGYSLLQEKDNS